MKKGSVHGATKSFEKRLTTMKLIKKLQKLPVWQGLPNSFSINARTYSAFSVPKMPTFR